MNKVQKIILNIVIFALIAGFGYYMVHSIIADDRPLPDAGSESGFVSPFKAIQSIEAASNVVNFYVYDDKIYAVLADRISIFDLQGGHQRDFTIDTDARDIRIDDATIYLLYPTRIELRNLTGQRTGGWATCSDKADYCAFTTTKDYVFITDAHHKHIVQYDKEGHLIRFIRSPDGFIIPSYAFDIISINDTIYVSNSGRHQIESYTLCGKFITSFGQSGARAGAFAGCCNPVYIAVSAGGNIITSEKGNPRITSYSREGKFRTILFDNHSLGGGTNARRMRVSGDDILIANRRAITLYRIDTAHATTSKSCGGCKNGCPLRKGMRE
jgi:hypothetical protein